MSDKRVEQLENRVEQLEKDKGALYREVNRLYSVERLYGELMQACKDAIDDAEIVCGGDGEGCEVYREYSWPRERKWRKCGQCPMDGLSCVKTALDSDPAQGGDG